MPLVSAPLRCPSLRDAALVLAALSSLSCTVAGATPCAMAPACEGDVFSLSGCGPSIALERCADRTMRCDPDRGCTGCVPDAVRCDGADVLRCDADGQTWRREETCGGTNACEGGVCVDACELAARERSYLGCAYDAVSTLNALLVADFAFGIVVGNPGGGDAHVRVLHAGEELARVTVAPGDTATVRLAPIEALSEARYGSVLVPDGSFEVLSDRPIAAYQFNPLEFRRSPDCRFTGTGEDLGCFSFTNDASLLLPRTALGTEHLIDTVDGGGTGPAFVTIVASRGANVRVVPTSALLAATDASLPAVRAGEALELALAAGDVLEVVSAGSSLSGTEITSDVPISVFAGNDCANVPAHFGACDHLEEVMPPVPTWGTEVIAAVPAARDGEPVVLRVLSGEDGNEVTISGLPHPIPLDRGERFELVTHDDLAIEATRPILVTQYLVGAAFYDRDGGHAGGGALGDPSMGIVAPVAQYRRDYVFVIPSTYVESFAAIVVKDGDDALLDGQPIEGLTPLEGTGFLVARVPMLGGSHTLVSTHGAGLTIYGLAPYTSYLLPGGLDVELLR
jgi:hypothetical protein